MAFWCLRGLRVGIEPLHNEEFIGYVPDPSVVVERVNKAYRQRGTTSEDAGSGARHQDDVNTAVKGISFFATRGESIGVLGRNGSGKSTLLRMIAGAEAPTSGSIWALSKPTFLGVKPALIGYLDARQNAYLGCLALGVPKAEAILKSEEIVEWAELGPAALRPLSTYSSGQSARLSFAISTAIRSDILIIDEALSTGDIGFAEKAQQRMRDMLNDAGTVFLVSHSMSEIEKNCNRALWINDGVLVADGDAKLVSGSYKKWISLRNAGDVDGAKEQLSLSKRYYPPKRFVVEDEDTWKIRTA